MFVAMILVCGLQQGNFSCQAIVNKMPMATEDECYNNIRDNVPAISDGLPTGAFIADFECVSMSIAG